MNRIKVHKIKGNDQF